MSLCTINEVEGFMLNPFKDFGAGDAVAFRSQRWASLEQACISSCSMFMTESRQMDDQNLSRS